MLPRVAVLFANTLFGAAAQKDWVKCCACPLTVVCERPKPTAKKYNVEEAWNFTKDFFGGTIDCEKHHYQWRSITVPGEACSRFSIEKGGATEEEQAFRSAVVSEVYDKLHAAAATTMSRKASVYFTKRDKNDTEHKGLETEGYTQLVKDTAKDQYERVLSVTIDAPTCVYIPDGSDGLKMEKVKDRAGTWRVGLAVPDVPDVKEGAESDDIVKSYSDLFKGRSARLLRILRTQAATYKEYTRRYVFGKGPEGLSWKDFMEAYDGAFKSGGGEAKCSILGDESGKVEDCKEGSCITMPAPKVQKRRVHGRSVKWLRTLLARVLKSG